MRGRLIHRLLERLPDLPAAARRQAAAAYLDAAAALAPAALAEIAAATFAVLDDPAFGVVFGPGSRAEVPIVGRLGTHVVAGQIDRLAVAGDTIAIVDYKGQRPAPRDERDVAVVYLRQMAAYRAVLRKIYPDKSVACFLLWTDGPKLMRLADDKLDEIATSNFA
jgi:ATP-dependent helicase/nuclease subunit A